MTNHICCHDHSTIQIDPKFSKCLQLVKLILIRMGHRVEDTELVLPSIVSCFFANFYYILMQTLGK